MTAGELLQRLAIRIRGEAHTFETMLAILSKAQQLVNASQQAVLASTSLVTVPYLQLYDLSTYVPEQVHVLTVQEGNRDLDRLRDWKELGWHDRRWFRRFGDRFESFALLGRDLLILYPAKDYDSSVTVVYAKLLDPFESGESIVELPDDLTPLVLDVAESLLLIKERRVESIAAAVERISSVLGVTSGQGRSS